MPNEEEPNKDLVYAVQKAGTAPAGDGAWDSAAWGKASVLSVAHFHPKSSDHRPEVRVKALYDDKKLYVLFRVKDRYVISTHTGYQAPVCRDSCVECFVRPKPDKGYFNFEIGCGGNLLLYYIEDPTRTPDGFKQRTEVPWELAQRVYLYHSLPVVVAPERQEETEWRIELHVPFAMLEHYVGPLGTLAGQTWRGNFYKCADDSSHPHWAAWAPIAEELNFHQPRFFGTLRFAA